MLDMTSVTKIDNGTIYSCHWIILFKCTIKIPSIHDLSTFYQTSVNRSTDVRGKTEKKRNLRRIIPIDRRRAAVSTGFLQGGKLRDLERSFGNWGMGFRGVRI